MQKPIPEPSETKPEIVASRPHSKSMLPMFSMQESDLTPCPKAEVKVRSTSSIEGSTKTQLQEQYAALASLKKLQAERSRSNSEDLSMMTKNVDALNIEGLDFSLLPPAEIDRFRP